MKVKHRKTSAEREAVQWFPNVVVEGVELVPVTITYSKDGNRYRIEGDGVTTNMWVETDGSRQYPDAFWTVPPTGNYARSAPTIRCTACSPERRAGASRPASTASCSAVIECTPASG